MKPANHPSHCFSRRAFTLTELLAAMGIIALLATITAFSVRAISRDSRLSSGMNTVTATLGNARAMAIKTNRPVMVVFRVKWDLNKPEQRQVTELVLAQWTGESRNLQPLTAVPEIVDRFVPMIGQQSRTLPPGIKVAAPWYDFGSPGSHDHIWITQSEFRAMIGGVGEAAGRQFAVVYGPDGTLLTRNPSTDASEFFVDFNGNAFQNYTITGTPFAADTNHDWEYDHPDDEVNINPAPFLAVYDDDAAREGYDTTQWGDEDVLRDDLSEYIMQNANRLNFNRYSGVALTQRGAGG